MLRSLLYFGKMVYHTKSIFKNIFENTEKPLDKKFSLHIMAWLGLAWLGLAWLGFGVKSAQNSFLQTLNPKTVPFFSQLQDRYSYRQFGIQTVFFYCLLKLSFLKSKYFTCIQPE